MATARETISRFPAGRKPMPGRWRPDAQDFAPLRCLRTLRFRLLDLRSYLKRQRLKLQSSQRTQKEPWIDGISGREAQVDRSGRLWASRVAADLYQPVVLVMVYTSVPADIAVLDLRLPEPGLGWKARLQAVSFRRVTARKFSRWNSFSSGMGSSTVVTSALIEGFSHRSGNGTVF